MSFWGTAAAAFVGGLGVLVIGGLIRFGWLMFFSQFTAYGRLQTKAGRQVEEALKDIERRERGAL